MAAIGASWADGSWVESEGWASGSWAALGTATPIPILIRVRAEAYDASAFTDEAYQGDTEDE